MAIEAGTYRFGPHNASLTVETTRSGAASKAGHDLVLEVDSWDATLDVADTANLQLSADSTSLHVREGKGGAKKLDDGDKADIKKSIDKDILKKQDVTFTSTSCEHSDGGLKVSGDLELVGTKKPVSFDLSEAAGKLTGSTTLKQSDWGIKPYSALFGALKVDDEVRVVVEGSLE